MRSCTPNCTRKRRSRYLVVREEMRMPKPKPSPAIIRINSGVNSIQRLGWISEPFRAKKSMNAKKKTNWIVNVIRFEIRIETGTARRGKYTLPNKFALLTNVSDVFVRQLAK